MSTTTRRSSRRKLEPEQGPDAQSSGDSVGGRVPASSTEQEPAQEQELAQEQEQPQQEAQGRQREQQQQQQSQEHEQAQASSGDGVDGQVLASSTTIVVDGFTVAQVEQAQTFAATLAQTSVFEVDTTAFNVDQFNAAMEALWKQRNGVTMKLGALHLYGMVAQFMQAENRAAGRLTTKRARATQVDGRRC